MAKHAREDTMPTDENYKPSIPNKVRDVAYIAGLIITGITGIAVASVSALVPDAAATATTIGTSVLSATGLIVSGLGVAYRPGSNAAASAPTLIYNTSNEGDLAGAQTPPDPDRA